MKTITFSYQNPFALLQGSLQRRFSPSGGAGQASLPFVPAGAARLREVLRDLSAAVRGLPCAHLTELERESAGAAIFRGGGAFVDQVVDGVLGRPALYPELQEEARRLSARQAEADLWLRLRGLCGRFYALANDSYLLTQSEVIRDGERLLERVDGEVGRDPARQAGLAAARLVLMRRRNVSAEQKKKARGKVSQAVKEAAEAQVYRMLRKTLQRHHARLKG